VIARDRSLEEYVRRAVTPHLVPNANPAHEQIRAQAEATIESEMRALMHHPHFQALEALWRGVDFLVRRLETDERLRVYLVDVSKSELAADIADGTDPATSGMHRLLVESSIAIPGAMPWAVVAGCYTFGEDEADVELLGRLASLARAAGAPWISAAHPTLVGTPSFGDVPDIDDWSDEVPAGWASLRRSPDARYLGLALPRFLLRVPYGRKSDACESIQFEEVADPPKHEELLWGTPAIACALLLGEAFAESGWALRPRLDITGLPLHVVRTSTDVDALPCAEAVLSERAMEWVLERGIMPLLSMKGGDAVRLGRFQSIADPIASLTGRWSHDSDDGR
jgi:type VI secretion system protein ImpC